MLDNIILTSDSYKVSHHKQYPPKTEVIYSYFESRGGKWNEVVFFGLQYLLKKYLVDEVVTKEKIHEAAEIFADHFGNDKLFNRAGWEHILNEHGGKLPVEIKAVPEGTVVPYLNVLMTIENTDPKCYWLTNYLETLLVQAWYPCTVATQSREMKRILQRFAKQTGSIDGLDFRLVDFGCRGVSSVEQAALGGAAHLVNFQATDTLPAISLLRQYYGGTMPGFSIPAYEHSTVTSWGMTNSQSDCVRNALRQFPTGLLAMVGDSYDIFDFVGSEFKDDILNRDGVFIVRPDSGVPHRVCNRVLDILGAAFGYTMNEKGFKVLNPKVRLIQGDGININTMEKILKKVADNGWSSDNISFGSGGGLLMNVNRDTQKFAFKCSEAIVDGNSRNVFKDPVTDKGKKSKTGRLVLSRRLWDNGNIEWKTKTDADRKGGGFLETVYRNGELLIDHKLDDVRKRAAL
jgi:nicotinamide phosphoribosyltransferase